MQSCESRQQVWGVVPGARARVRTSPRPALTGNRYERSPRRIQVGGRIGPPTLSLREPCPRELTMLPRFGLLNHGVVASQNECLGNRVAPSQRYLREQQAGLHLTPWILQAFINPEGHAR